MKKYRSFKEARKFVLKLKLKNVRDWEKYSKSSKRPVDIPSNPDRQYKKEWSKLPVGKKWAYWLGTNNFSPKHKKFRSFAKARAFTRKLKLKSKHEWEKYCKSGKKPTDIPSNPRHNYKEFTNYPDWLGTKRVSSKNIRPYKEAQRFVLKTGTTSQSQWERYCKSGKKPNDIPVNPTITYKECKGWTDFLGTGKISTQEIRKKNLETYLSYEEAEKQARILCKKLNINSPEDWKKAYRAGKIPKNLPEKPWRFYAEWYGKPRGKRRKNKNEKI